MTFERNDELLRGESTSFVFGAVKANFFFDFSYAEVNVISTTKSFTFGNDHKLKVVLDSDFPRHYFFFLIRSINPVVNH